MISSTQPDLIFFIHIMKAGGSSLDYAIRSAIGPCAVFPNHVGMKTLTRYFDIKPLLRLSAREKASIRYLRGHFPFCVGDLFHRRIRHIAFFRDPVTRTVSHLAMYKQQEEFQSLSLTEIYERKGFFDREICNLQCRYFAHNLTPELGSVFAPKRLTRDDLARAKQRVAQCKFIGLQEDFRNSLELLGKVFGFRFRGFPKANVGKPTEIPKSLRERIAEDNAIDLEFFEFVRALYYHRMNDYLAIPA